MKERPILFSAPMVRAVLNGTKTQTRRTDRYMEKYPPTTKPDIGLLAKSRNGESLLTATWDATNGKFSASFCPYGKPGDRLWVRENFQPFISDDAVWQGVNWKTGAGYLINYPATDGIHEYIDADDNVTDAVKPSIHMPRWASRILLEIIGVRVERLRDISEADAIAEGCHQDSRTNGAWTADGDTFTSKDDGPVRAYRMLWESINGEGSWDTNPWVWVIEFKVVKP